MTETEKQPKYKEVPVPGEIFKAFILGNTILPQTFSGIYIYTLASLFENKEQLYNFSCSRLSESQIKHLLKLTENLHGSYRVNCGIGTKPNQRVITEARLHEVWQKTRDESLHTIYQYIHNVEDRGYIDIFKNRSYVYFESALIDITRFLKSNDSEKIKELLYVLQNTLEKSEGKALTKKYRQVAVIDNYDRLTYLITVRKRLNNEVSKTFPKPYDANFRRLIEFLVFMI